VFELMTLGCDRATCTNRAIPPYRQADPLALGQTYRKCVNGNTYREWWVQGASLIKNSNPPLDHHRALGVGIPWGPGGFFMGEVHLYLAHKKQRV